MGGPLAGAARYLGVSADELLKDLRSGKTPPAIAKANLTKAQEQQGLGMITRGIDGFVSHGFHFRMRLDPDRGDQSSGHGSFPAPAASGL